MQRKQMEEDLQPEAIPSPLTARELQAPVPAKGPRSAAAETEEKPSEKEDDEPPRKGKARKSK